jgi:hypothetical protein
MEARRINQYPLPKNIQAKSINAMAIIGTAAQLD